MRDLDQEDDLIRHHDLVGFLHAVDTGVHIVLVEVRSNVFNNLVYGYRLGVFHFEQVEQGQLELLQPTTKLTPVTLDKRSLQNE